MYWLKQNKTRLILIVFVLILFSLPSVFSLLRPGFFLTDDGEWMIIRFSAFYEALRDGQFPVRFLSRLNHGYGYPVANFLYPGFMYLGVPIHVLGFSFTSTIKIIFASSLLFSAVFSFLWLRKLFHEFSAFIGSLVYLYLPYHLYNLTTRGSVGELMAMAIVPFVLWQIERKSFFWLSLGIAALILAHNTLATLFLPVFVGYIFVRSKEKFSIAHNKQTILAILFGFLVSAFFWIPALYDLQFVVFSKTQVSEWQAYFVSSPLIGIGTLGVGIVSIFLFLKDKRKDTLHRKLTVFFLIALVLSVFFATSLSGFLWNIIPVSFIQFPFRFLALSVLSAGFLAAYAFDHCTKRNQQILGVLLFLVLFFFALPYLPAKVYFDKPDTLYSTNQDTTTVQNEYLPVWVERPPQAAAKEKVVTNTGIINNLQVRPNSISFRLTTDKQASVIVNTVYFPGWVAMNNGRSQEIFYNNPEGVINLVLPKGVSDVKVFFAKTVVRVASEILSFGSFLVLCAISVNHFLSRKKNI